MNTAETPKNLKEVPYPRQQKKNKLILIAPAKANTPIS